ncbi:hypothetical protein [Eisenbergiella massiliensis]|nr:hypothetical protein [Eisenbergiella massiliensis]
MGKVQKNTFIKKDVNMGKVQKNTFIKKRRKLIYFSLMVNKAILF